MYEMKIKSLFDAAVVPEIVDFYGRFTYQNSGPWIQGNYKKKFFDIYSKDIPLKVAFHDSKRNIKKRPTKYFHCLFPHDLNNYYGHDNFSLGPNIAYCMKLGGMKPEFDKKILVGRQIIADSYWNKAALCECFDLDPALITIITTYIDEGFYKAKIKHNKRFTVGLVGYPGRLSGGLSNIKNINIVKNLAPIFKNWKFEICCSAGREREMEYLHSSYKRHRNVEIKVVPHKEMPDVMSRWHCYLGVSKAERGPTTIQEATALGCVTVCSNHTGYADFDPVVPMDIEPFKDIRVHSPRFDVVVDSLRYVYANFDDLFKESQIKRRFFWENRNPRVITYKWKKFLYENATRDYRIDNQHRALIQDWMYESNNIVTEGEVF